MTSYRAPAMTPPGSLNRYARAAVRELSRRQSVRAALDSRHPRPAWPEVSPVPSFNDWSENGPVNLDAPVYPD